jgi:hypothetical protein
MLTRGSCIVKVSPLCFNFSDNSLLPVELEPAFGLNKLPILSIDEADVVRFTAKLSLPEPMVTDFKSDGLSDRALGVSGTACILAN